MFEYCFVLRQKPVCIPGGLELLTAPLLSPGSGTVSTCHTCFASVTISEWDQSSKCTRLTAVRGPHSQSTAYLLGLRASAPANPSGARSSLRPTTQEPKTSQSKSTDAVVCSLNSETDALTLRPFIPKRSDLLEDQGLLTSNRHQRVLTALLSGCILSTVRGLFPDCVLGEPTHCSWITLPQTPLTKSRLSTLCVRFSSVRPVIVQCLLHISG